jgi:hypothetical protein
MGFLGGGRNANAPDASAIFMPMMALFPKLVQEAFPG